MWFAGRNLTFKVKDSNVAMHLSHLSGKSVNVTLYLNSWVFSGYIDLVSNASLGVVGFLRVNQSGFLPLGVLKGWKKGFRDLTSRSDFLVTSLES